MYGNIEKSTIIFNISLRQDNCSSYIKIKASFGVPNL